MAATSGKCERLEERTACNVTWKYLDITLGLESYLEDFKTHILPVVRPKWNGDQLKHTVFDVGLTNKLVAIWDTTSLDRGDKVLLRINGEGTDIFIDRTDEIIIMLLLNRNGLYPPVYVQLANGLCYGFAKGRNVLLEEVRSDPLMAMKIARAVARFHAVKLPELFRDRKPVIWAQIDNLMERVTSDFGSTERNEYFSRTIGSVALLRKEVEELRTELAKCTSPIVLCHNDLVFGNLIYDDESDAVTLIDLEYGGPNYLAFEIGDYFCEFSGLVGVDYSRYPSEPQQKVWIRTYLEESAKIKGEDPAVAVTDGAVHTLYREANKFALGAHLMWCLWGLMQAQLSTIDFDYLEFSNSRFSEYKEKKEAFFKL